MNKYRTSMVFKKILLVTGLILIIFLISHLSSKKDDLSNLRCPNCNVILIGVDTLRADHLGAYGYTKIQTPNIDSLAKSGMLFKDNYSQSINTTPSFMSIFTSLYPTDHGLLTTPTSIGIPLNLLATPTAQLVEINPNIETLTSILHDNGYQTQGFATSVAIYSKFGFGKGFDSYTGDNVPVQRANFLNWLKNYKSGKFFAFFHDVTPHSPYNQRKRYVEDLTVKNGKVIAGNNDFLNQFNTNNPSDMKKLTQLYDKNVEDVDNYVGTVINTLKAKGLMDKTIIVFMADHGEEIGDHGQLGHQEFYNEISHVPLMIYIPTLKKSTTVNQNTRSIDVMPTILDLLGIQTSAPMRGVSLLAMITNPLKNFNLPAISIMSDNESIIWDGFKFTNQSNQQKLLGKLPTLELYDLKNDPGEKVNLIGKNLAIESKLKNMYSNIINEKGYARTPIPFDEPQLEQDVINRLRSLGY